LRLCEKTGFASIQKRDSQLKILVCKVL